MAGITFCFKGSNSRKKWLMKASKMKYNMTQNPKKVAVWKIRLVVKILSNVLKEDIS